MEKNWRPEGYEEIKSAMLAWRIAQAERDGGQQWGGDDSAWRATAAAKAELEAVEAKYPRAAIFHQAEAQAAAITYGANSRCDWGRKALEMLQAGASLEDVKRMLNWGD